MAPPAGTPSTAPGAASGWLLVVVTGVLSAGNSVVFALLADLQDTFGLPTWGLGVLSAASFILGLVGQLVLAPLADRGHARALLLAGLGLTVGALVAFVVGSELWHFVVARGVEGLALGLFLPAARAVTLRLDPANMGRNLGRLSAGELAGFTLGPVVGAGLASAGSLDTPFVVLAAVVAVAFAVLLARPGLLGAADQVPVERGAPRAAPSGAASVLGLLRLRAVLVAAFLVLALTFPIGVYDALWAPYLDDRGASTFFIGLSFTLYGIPYILLAPTGGRLADRYEPARIALVSIVCMAPLLVLYGVLARPGLILAASMVEGTIQAAAVPSMQLAMAQATPPDRIAAGQGLAGAVQFGGAAVAALLAAPLYGVTGPAVVFGATAAVTLGLGLVAWALQVGRRAAPATA